MKKWVEENWLIVVAVTCFIVISGGMTFAAYNDYKERQESKQYHLIEKLAFPVVGTEGFMWVYRYIKNGEVLEIQVYTQEGCMRLQEVTK